VFYNANVKTNLQTCSNPEFLLVAKAVFIFVIDAEGVSNKNCLFQLLERIINAFQAGKVQLAQPI